MLDKTDLINNLDWIAQNIREDENGLAYVRGINADGLRRLLIDASTSLQAYGEEKNEYLLKLDAVVTAFIESGCKHA